MESLRIIRRLFAYGEVQPTPDFLAQVSRLTYSIQYQVGSDGPASRDLDI